MIKRLTKSIFLLFVVTVYAIETLDFNSAELDRISIMTTNATELESYKTCSHDIYENLVELAGLCSVAYCISKRDIEKGPLDKVFRPTEGLSGTGYVAVDHTPGNSRIFIVWRGSTTIGDWLSNIATTPVKYIPYTFRMRPDKFECDGCKVHRGFYRSIASFFSEVIKDVQFLKEQLPDYEIVVTGHSLGGAQATLIGIELKLMGYDPLIVSYEAPKLGNKKMTEWMNDLFDSESLTDRINEGMGMENGLVRVTHKGDYVPLLPPTRIFRQSGVHFCIDKTTLPHPEWSVIFMGTSKYHPLKRADMRTMLTFDLLHAYQHEHVFVRMQECFEMMHGLDDE